MKKPRKLRHFPVRSVAWPDLWFVGLCGYESDKPGEFVNPQKYEPGNVLPCCKSKQQGAAVIVKESA